MKGGRFGIIFVLSFMILTSAVFSAMNTSIKTHDTWAQTPPVAVIDANQTNVSELANVTLNASGSYSPEGTAILNYNWTQIDSHPPISLVSNGSTTSFQAPDVPGPYPVNFTFSLVVTDLNNLSSAPVLVNVTVNNINQTGPAAFGTPTTEAPVSLLPTLTPAPLVTGTFPANSSTNIPTEINKITATFDQDINISSAKITLKDGVGNEIQTDFVAKGPTITIAPLSNLTAGTNYTVTVEHVIGLGPTNASSTSFSFATVALPVPEASLAPTPPTEPQPANNPPQALDQQVTTEADKPIAITIGAADSDPNESLSAAIVTPPQPDQGSLGDIDQNTGNVTYTPAPGFIG
ncbi:MAG TPA: Ig-like domain-containing protein, partial [Nitrososphaeraceae archaeon]